VERDERSPVSPEEARARVREALEKAEWARRARRFDEGIERLIDALKYKVDADQIYYRLGNLYFDAGDLGRAEYAYRRAIEFNPRHVNAHHNLAVVYKKTGRVEESVRMQKKAVRIQVGGWLGRPARERGAAGGGRDGAAAPAGPGRAAGPAGGGSGEGPPYAAREDDRWDGDPWADDPTHHYFDPRLHDPEGFRRFGKRVALIGFLVFIGVGVAYLALVYLIGFWLF